MLEIARARASNLDDFEVSSIQTSSNLGRSEAPNFLVRFGRLLPKLRATYIGEEHQQPKRRQN